MDYIGSSIPAHAHKVCTAAQMREFDRRTVEEFGVPSIVLMENAGRHVFEAVRGILGDVSGRRVCVVAGRGNNGGDGFVVARHLRDAGASVSVYLLGDPATVKGDAQINLDILVKTGLEITAVDSSAQVRSALIHSDAVVDAIFGTGLRGEITGLTADVIDSINDAHRPTIAVDIPSGLDSDTGAVLGRCVHADVTVTFALPKLGHFTYPGAAYVGKLIVGDIGIPHSLYDEVDVELVSESWVAERLPARPNDSNKGTFGTCVVVAGSAGMTGAATMASEAVLRAGAGLSILCVPKGLQSAMAVKLTEVITRGLPDDSDGAIGPESLGAALEACEKARSVVLGCGMGHAAGTCSFVQDLARKVDKPSVIDADGLNCLSEDLSVLQGDHGDVVITPHPGEMSRLLGTSIAEIQSDRIGAARRAAAELHCIAVLKGAHTLIAEPSGRVYINTTSNVGMATGGTGDVLAGTIGGLLAQGMTPLDAAVCGVFIHGLAGDIAASRLGEAGMIAGDVLSSLPPALKHLYELKPAR